MRFLNWYFIFLLIPLIYMFFRKPKIRAIKYSSINLIKEKMTKTNKLYLLGKYLIFTGLVFLIFALMRPQTEQQKQNLKKEGIDIVMTLDVSLSMKADDFAPNRLEVAKNVILDFVKKRTDDRIGFVIFAGGAYTKLPLTLDYLAIKNEVMRINFNDMTNNNGTAIGMGIAVAVNRLKQSKAKSKVIILATDGSNNAGDITPESAANIAKDLGIRIYTIGVGSDTRVVRTLMGVKQVKSDLDEGLLQEVARITNGKYFRAKDSKSLKEVFDNIDQLERTKIDESDFFIRDEKYKIFVRIGLLFLIIGLFFDKFKMIRIP